MATKIGRHVLWLGLLLELAACERGGRAVVCNEDGASCVSGSVGLGDPRLYADPPYGLGFACVEIGCDEEQIITLSNRGRPDVMITKLRVRTETSPDMHVRLVKNAGTSTEQEIPWPTTAAPYRLRDDTLDLAVRYTPRDAISDSGLIDVEWYDGEVKDGSAKIIHEELPLRARSLGDATALLEPSTVSFGYVAVEAHSDAVIRIKNISTENSVLVIHSVDISRLPVSMHLGLGWNNMANSEHAIEIPLSFLPTELGGFFGDVVLHTNDPQNPELTVKIQGTSLPMGQLVRRQPFSGIADFREKRVDEHASVTMVVQNIGGTSMDVRPIIEGTGNHGFSLLMPGDVPEVALAPFAMLSFQVVLHVLVPGDATVDVIASDTARLRAHVTGLAPHLTVTPVAMRFAPIAQGWLSEPTMMQLKNDGYGPLTIWDIASWGNTEAIRVMTTPDFPLTLWPGEPAIEIPVVIRGLDLGAVNGEVRIRSDSIDTSVYRVLVSGQVSSCNEVCFTPHATPSCMSGTCTIQQCDAGWYNMDEANVNNWRNGCECQAERDGRDIAGNCADGFDGGDVGDRCSSAPDNKTFKGVLQSATDVDVYYFHNRDSGCIEDFFTGDSSESRVTLLDGPPGLALCARIRSNGSGCGDYTTVFDPSVCGQTQYRKGNTYGSDDSRDTTFWLLWRPGAAPVCQPYAVQISGRD